MGETSSEYNPDRDFVLKMRNAGKNVVIFYGSQTGTAEDFATRLAKDIQSSSVRPLVLDPELYDWQCLAALAEDELVILILATAGEGEPTDNMEAWFDALASDRENPDDSELPEFRQPEDKPDLDEESPLSGTSFAVFGLGNNTYEQFNHHSRVIDKRMQRLGAHRIGERGEGDDDSDIEEDFAQWKEATLPLIREFLGSATPSDSGDESSPELTWKVVDMSDDKVWIRGEFSEAPSTAFDARHPYTAPVVTAVDLTPSADRHLLHVEVDLTGSGMRYEAGDHIGIYPTNSDEEVDLLLGALGLLPKADSPIAVRATDPYAAQQSLFPVGTTTYRAAFRHYLEITTPVPRAHIKSLLLPFAQSDAARDFLRPLAEDKDAHAATVAAGCLTPARLINAVREAEVQSSVPDAEQFSIPVEAAFELCPRLQSRLYSISSSSKVQPEQPSITAVVLQYEAKTELARLAKLGARRCGVATNYLLAVALVEDSKKHAVQSFTLQPPATADLSKRSLTVPVYIRKSTFRLPSDASTPIIMIGPGTGLAPMRGFIQERAQLARDHPEVPQGTALLFFGARTAANDYMYQDELEAMFEDIRSAAPESQIITAFSRDQPQKIYVQHRLAEHAELVYKTLLNGQEKLNGPAKAHVYVCGDAKLMAKDVVVALAQLIAEREQVGLEVANKWISEMRKLSRYQEDVWS
ncbi:riboflavin synthase domain-like protein [Martensiomyces pterosporus]|nr:riboflavin synthase domain-like protein [Martensiomyces pterosporus]